VSEKTSVQAAAYILSLPSALQTAVKVDSLPPFESDDAIRVLERQTAARQQRSYMDSVVTPHVASSPIECRLYDEVSATDKLICSV